MLVVLPIVNTRWWLQKKNCFNFLLISCPHKYCPVAEERKYVQLNIKSMIDNCDRNGYINARIPKQIAPKHSTHKFDYRRRSIHIDKIELVNEISSSTQYFTLHEFNRFLSDYHMDSVFCVFLTLRWSFVFFLVICCHLPDNRQSLFGCEKILSFLMVSFKVLATRGVLGSRFKNVSLID